MNVIDHLLCDLCQDPDIPNAVVVSRGSYFVIVETTPGIEAARGADLAVPTVYGARLLEEGVRDPAAISRLFSILVANNPGIIHVELKERLLH